MSKDRPWHKTGEELPSDGKLVEVRGHSIADDSIKYFRQVIGNEWCNECKKPVTCDLMDWPEWRFVTAPAPVADSPNLDHIHRCVECHEGWHQRQAPGLRVGR